MTPCARCPIRRLASFRDFTTEELAFIKSWKTGERTVRAGECILRENEPDDNLYTILSGWAFKFKSLEDGRRQILNYALVGDLIGLQGSLAGTTTHSVEALTDVVLCVLPRARLMELFGLFAGLSFDVTWLAAREEWMLGEYLLSVGQRGARERVAFILLDLYGRARKRNMLRDGRLAFPVTQSHLSDTLGFSLVHTNKTLQRLRQSGAFKWSDGFLQLLDEEQLRDVANWSSWPSALERPFL